METVIKEFLENSRNKRSEVIIDFNEVMGDTIKEKFQSIVLELVNIIRGMKINSIEDGYNWIWASPEVVAVIETIKLTLSDKRQACGYYNNICDTMYAGYFEIFDEYHLVKDKSVSPNTVIVGYNNNSSEVKIKNFVE